MVTVIPINTYLLQSQAESRLHRQGPAIPVHYVDGLDIVHMLAAEQMFFLGAPLAHVVAYEEHLRAKRRADQFRAIERRTGSRARKH